FKVLPSQRYFAFTEPACFSLNDSSLISSLSALVH
ncbi:hypothetical protein VCHENC02_3763B, partial [Vibrio harveyi]